MSKNKNESKNDGIHVKIYNYPAFVVHSIEELVEMLTERSDGQECAAICPA